MSENKRPKMESVELQLNEWVALLDRLEFVMSFRNSGFNQEMDYTLFEKIYSRIYGVNCHVVRPEPEKQNKEEPKKFRFFKKG